MIKYINQYYLNFFRPENPEKLDLNYVNEKGKIGMRKRLKWWEVLVSNQRPIACEAIALPLS